MTILRAIIHTALRPIAAAWDRADTKLADTYAAWGDDE